MGDERVFQRRIEKIERFLIAFACLGDIEPEPRQFVRDTRGAADFQPPAGQMIEHADFLDDPPRLVERQHDPHGAEPQPFRALGDCRDQQVRRRAVGRHGMMFAEKDALETLVFRPRPDAESVVIGLRYGGGIEPVRRRVGRVHEFEYPRLDHLVSPVGVGVRIGSASVGFGRAQDIILRSLTSVKSIVWIICIDIIDVEKGRIGNAVRRSRSRRRWPSRWRRRRGTS